MGGPSELRLKMTFRLRPKRGSVEFFPMCCMFHTWQVELTKESNADEGKRVGEGTV